MNTIKIINPAAGRGKAVNEISNDVRYYVSKSVGDIERFVCKTLLKEPETHFIICGGDGSINEAVNGVMRAGASETALLSCIATGTGNDFVKYDNGTEEPVRCDVMKYGDRYFINILNIGFDCDVVQRAEKLKKKPLISGSLAYGLGVVGTVAGQYGSDISVKMTLQNGETETFEDDYMLCVAANAQYYGGGFKPAPLADITDGLIDVVLVKKITRKKFVSIVGTYKKGGHIDPETKDIIDKYKDIMTYRQVKRVDISGITSVCADGEIETRKSVSIEVVPKAINFLL